MTAFPTHHVHVRVHVLVHGLANTVYADAYVYAYVYVYGGEAALTTSARVCSEAT